MLVVNGELVERLIPVDDAQSARDLTIKGVDVAARTGGSSACGAPRASASEIRHVISLSPDLTVAIIVLAFALITIVALRSGPLQPV